ncbi:MAG: TolC family protein [Acidobacteriota bacterium]
MSVTAQGPTERDALRSARRTVELPRPLDDAPVGSSARLVTSLLANQLDLSLLGAVPAGERSETSLPLGLVGALERALEHNLGSQLQRSRTRSRSARRRQARSRLLPVLDLTFEQRTDELNFDASAFARFRPPTPQGVTPEGVSGFQFFDARVESRWLLFDRAAQLQLRSARALERASKAGEQAVRSSLLLVTGNLYYRVALLEKRLEVARQRQTQAEAFEELVDTGFESGLRTTTEQLAAEIAALEAERSTDVAEGELEKARLRLAQTIGLPLGQRFHLLDGVRYTPMRQLTLAEGVAQALASRGDVAALREELGAARAELAATRARRLPSVEIEADWGEIGPTASDRRSTYGFAALASLPLFRGGELAAERVEAAEEVRLLEQRLGALEAQIHYQLAEGLIDERTTDRLVRLAQRTVELSARRQVEVLERFDAGVADSLDVLAARTELAAAQGRELDALLAHRTAKGAVARALGLDERTLLDILRAETQTPSEANRSGESE